MEMIKALLVGLVMLGLVGCGPKANVCPIYPKPNAEVRAELAKVFTPSVHDWLDKQFKLMQKLEECKD